jgi:class 3 adenylate cyclase/tetratricopeptide (TPR) repeat protein
VFGDLVASTALAERLDAEVFRELVFTFLERMAGVVEAHGGAVEHLAGDGVMGVFGAERAQGDDALRAVTAASAMLDELDRLNDELSPRIAEPLRMRIGVNTGTVVVGRTVAGHAVSVGDPMNVAARLQAHAPAGEILIGADTHELVGREVEAEPAGELELRGREKPMPAFRVASIADEADAVPLAARPLVGRGRELGLLTVAFERSAARGSREFVSVLGDAGVGKSRLVAELAERYSERATPLVGRCLSYGEGITYWALTELIRRAVGIQEDDSTKERKAKLLTAVAEDPEGVAIARQLAQLLGLEPADEPGEQTAWAVRRLLEITAGRGPVIVVLDDLQWAEAALVELLLRIADEVTGPVLIVCMARFELLQRHPEWERACPTVIGLEPLSNRDAGTLVGVLAGDGLPEPLRERLVELAAGNPLFIEQALQMLVDDGALRARGDGWEATAGGAQVAVPPTVEAILAARVDNLTGSERACAECAAVIGMEFWARPLDELTGEPAGRALASLRRKLVIEPVRRPGGRGDMLRFRHLLLRDAVYEAIPKARRAHLHEQVAGWLEGWFADRLGEVEEIVGYHYETAARYSSQLLTGGDHGTRLAARAVEHLTAAGRRAAARQDDAQAAAFFGRVVALLGEDDPTRLRPLLDLGAALVGGGDIRRAESVLADARRAAAATGDPRLDAEVRVLEVDLRRLTNPRWWAANGRAEAAELARIFAGLDDDAGAAKAWHLVGKAHSDRGEQAAAQEAFEHALSYARRVESPGIEAWIRFWLLQAAVLGPTPCLDVIERARDTLAWARAHSNRSLEGNVLTGMGEMLARAGRIPDAQDAFAEARAVLGELGRSQVAYMPIWTAAVEPLASDPAGAERELRAAYEFFAGLGADHILATVAPMLAATLVPQGRLVEAIALTERAEGIAAPDDLDGQVKWRLARSAARVAESEHADAERLAREAVALAETTDSILMHADALAGLGYGLVAAGAADEALGPWSSAIELYEAKGDVVSAARWQAARDAHARAT